MRNLVAALCVLIAGLAGGAGYALNPQPLPPGIHAPDGAHRGHSHTRFDPYKN